MNIANSQNTLVSGTVISELINSTVDDKWTPRRAYYSRYSIPDYPPPPPLLRNGDPTPSSSTFPKWLASRCRSDRSGVVLDRYLTVQPYVRC